MNSQKMGEYLARVRFLPWLVMALIIFDLYYMFRPPKSVDGAFAWVFSVLVLCFVLSFYLVETMRALKDIYEKFERMEQAKQAPSERAPAGA